MQRIIINILRWISIIPCALIIYFLVRGTVSIMFYFAWKEEPAFMKTYIEPLIYCGFGGYASIYCTLYIAPIYKKSAALGMFILYVLLLLIIIYLVSTNKHFTTASLMEQIGMALGSFIAYSKIHTEE